MADHREGHRERARNKYVKNCERAHYEDYELLELLLFYAAPRGDTKGTAKALVQKFGSMDNIFNANIKQLQSVNGVGEKTAILLKLVGDISRRTHGSREEQVKIGNISQASKYFLQLLDNAPKEKFAVMVLDNGNRKQYCGVVSEGEFGMANVPLRELTCLVTDRQATGLIIAHNHPHGIAKPSVSDIDVTLKIRDFMQPLGVKLLDHLIIASGEAYSMRADLEFNKFFR